MMAMSSIQLATFGNNSLTGVPDSPYLENLNGEAHTKLLLLKTVVGVFIFIG